VQVDGVVVAEGVTGDSKVARIESLLILKRNILLRFWAHVLLPILAPVEAGPLSQDEFGYRVSPGHSEGEQQLVVRIHGHLDAGVEVAVGRLLVYGFIALGGRQHSEKGEFKNLSDHPFAMKKIVDSN